jgi:hypothetical protein
LAEVDPDALERFAATSRGRAQRFEELARLLTDGRVGRVNFGILPASFSLFDAYDAQLTACIDGADEGASVMDDIADTVTEMAAAYTAAELANVDLFKPTE